MISLPPSIANLIPSDISPFKLELLNLLHSPPHPGKVLRLILEAKNIKIPDFAKRIGVRTNLVHHVCKELVDVDTEFSLRLGVAFNMDHRYWLNLQREYSEYEVRIRMQDELLKIDTYP